MTRSGRRGWRGPLSGGRRERAVAIPELAMAHFATLRRELWARAAREAESRAALRALSAHGEASFAARPEEWAEFQAAQGECPAVWRRLGEAGRKGGGERRGGRERWRGARRRWRWGLRRGRGIGEASGRRWNRGRGGDGEYGGG
jgi:hypothetical protein